MYYSRCSVLGLDSLLTASRMTVLPHNKVFLEKESWQVLHFLCQAVLNSSDATESIDNLNTIDNAEEYLASLYIRKMILFVEDIVCL